MAGNAHSIEILQVEDSEVDVLMTKEALRHLHAPAVLHVVENGIEALKFLTKTDVYSQVPRPDLILLDLMMPNMDGFQVLESLHNDPEMQSIPVLIISARDPVGGPVVSSSLAITRQGGIAAMELLAHVQALVTKQQTLAPAADPATQAAQPG